MGNGLEDKLLSLCAKRFMAGETLEEMVDFAEKANQDREGVLINYLGENATSSQMAENNKNVYLNVIEAIKANRLKARPSLKLTQLGLHIGEPELCYNLTREIVAFARANGVLVEIDMEDSSCTQKTIDIVLRLSVEGFQNIRMVLQVYLYRTLMRDFYDLLHNGVPVRLCKGAYDESAKIAIKDEQIIRDMLKHLFVSSLKADSYPALATHDLKILKPIVRDYKERKDEFEIQLLFGIRRHYRKKLLKQGFDCWIYAPFGSKEIGFAYIKRRWNYILKNSLSFFIDETSHIIDSMFEKINPVSSDEKAG